ncbi:hypothetical protein Scep_028252 [Stephania cephalantha]|uniref:ABC transporter domain-containing protein n=1 Tax=Stephania cephalantha TaxID=152367 RepID=A0AAP0E9I6_9MAGN
MEELEPQNRTSLTMFNEAKLPITLEFKDIVYKVGIKKGGERWFCGKDSRGSEQERVILKGVTGAVLPGEMLAMLGPSGSGKTTLLTALGGRLGGHLTGTIAFNGRPFSNVVKRSTGFVTQDDVLYPHLTVEETLVFTALLRLPNRLSKDMKVIQAKAVMNQLGLTKCKNTIIGGLFTRGISGGERKRVSIGQELLINPSLLLLDEPTSGLDSTTAERIVGAVSDLARGGRTVIMTIHQPSSRLFYMFHKVLLLSDGSPLYFGKGTNAIEYFSSIGYSPSVSMNPSDFILDLANGVSDHSDDQVMVKQALALAYKNNLDEKLKEEMQEKKNTLSEHNLKDKEFGSWSTTWLQQFSVLLKRGLKERRHESFSFLTVFQVLAVAVICGLLWWKSTRLQDQIGLLFFYSTFWGNYPVIQSIFIFPNERRILTKERASGMYKLSSYFISRMAGDLPMELALPTVFVTITYWMAGLKPNAANFLETLFVLLFSVLSSQGLGLAIGAIMSDLRSATTLGGIIILSFNLVGGFFVAHVPNFMRWVQYISYNSHSYRLLLASQYKPDDVYECDPNASCRVDSIPIIKMVGINKKESSLAALAVMFLGYRLIAYFALRRIGVKR